MPRKKSKRGKTTQRRFTRQCFIAEKRETVFYAETIDIAHLYFRTFCQLRCTYIAIRIKQTSKSIDYPLLHVNEEGCKKCRLGEAIREGQNIWPLNIKFQTLEVLK